MHLDANKDYRRITIIYGPLTRKYVLAAPPYPKVGDSIQIEGEGASWTVTSVRPCKGPKVPLGGAQ
jgi:hypothetical protein